MGIKGLSRVLRTNIPNAIQNVSLASLKDQRIAVDANYYINKYYIGYNSIPELQRTKSCNEYIEQKIHMQYMHLRRYRIRPLFFFDGRAPDLKRDEIAHRKARTNRRYSISITIHDFTLLRQALTKYGIPYIDCPTEADFIMAALCSSGHIQGVLSDDMDMLPLGCNNLYREYSLRSETVEHYSLDTILTRLSMNQFIDLCIYMGCDYGFRIQEYVYECNTINVLELFEKYQSIENIVEYFRESGLFRMDKIENRDPTYFETYQSKLDPVRDLFQSPISKERLGLFIEKNQNILSK